MILTLVAFRGVVVLHGEFPGSIPERGKEYLENYFKAIFPVYLVVK